MALFCSFVALCLFFPTKLQNPKEFIKEIWWYDIKHIRKEILSIWRVTIGSSTPESLVFVTKYARGDCKGPCFDQLHAHILERQRNSKLFWMCAFSWSKHGRSQLPLAEKHFKMNSKPLKWTRDHFFYIFCKFLFCFEWFCGRYIFVCFIWNRFLTTFSFICYKKVLLSILRPSKTTFSYTTRSKTCLRS